MIRSGSTLQYQIAADLVESKGQGYRIGFVENCEQLKAAVERRSGFVVAKCHWPLAGLDALDCDVRYIYIYRDTRIHLMKCFELPKFVDLPVEPQEASEISQKFSRESQKKRIAEADYERYRIEAGRPDAPDPESLLKENHIGNDRSGMRPTALTW
jgi:hypothetical protein